MAVRGDGCTLTGKELEGGGTAQSTVSGRPDPDGCELRGDCNEALTMMRARPKKVGLSGEGVSRWGVRNTMGHLCRTPTQVEEGQT
jgi:hypothetical protein